MGNTESILEAVAVANINKNAIEDEAPAGVPETMAGCLSSDDGKEVFSSYEKYCQEQDRKEAWMAREDHRLRLKLIHSLMEEEELEDSDVIHDRTNTFKPSKKYTTVQIYRSL
jgi:hypothetical protein